MCFQDGVLAGRRTGVSPPLGGAGMRPQAQVLTKGVFSRKEVVPLTRTRKKPSHCRLAYAKTHIFYSS